jgi:hypothetical protein
MINLAVYPCSKCGEWLPSRSYYNPEHSGRSVWCMECTKEYQRGRYVQTRDTRIAASCAYARENRDSVNATQRARRRRNADVTRAQARARCADKRAWVASIKAADGCLLCGEQEPDCLDFHHLDPTQKEFRIATACVGSSKERIAEEIRKCVVLCANCHRKLHAGVLSLPADAGGES